MKVEANAKAYLYIVILGSSGQWTVLFPDRKIFGGNNLIEKGQPCTIPAESGDGFHLIGPPGVEKVSLMLSRTPEPDLEQLIYKAGDPNRTEEDKPKVIIAGNRPLDGALVGRLRDEMLSRDLVFEKYDGPASDGKQEKAVYAATGAKNGDAPLWVDLKLTHK